MAVNTTMQNTDPTNSIYRYRASGYYMLGQEKYNIDYTNIRSIVIDHDYDKNNMPLVYLILNISTKLIDTIIKNIERGVFILNIQKCIENSDMPDLWKDYISDTFIYFAAEDINKTDSRDYENANEGREDIYKELTLGLMSQKLVNNNKKTVNGIIKCSSTMSAVAYVMGTNRQIVMEPFEYNNPLSTIFLPPKTSVAKSIEYLNGLQTFYNSPYRYYMDFNVSYLLSSRGKAVPRKGDAINTVLILLRNDYDTASKLQGMMTDETNQFYQVEIAATNVEIADYRERTKHYSKLKYTNTAGQNNDFIVVQQTAESNFANKTRQVRVPNDNPNILLNEEKHSMFYVSINKTDLDASAFTPNKEYSINAEEVYEGSGYSGDFLLRRKRELYFKSTGNTADDKLTLSTMLFFEKVYEG